MKSRPMKFLKPVLFVVGLSILYTILMTIVYIPPNSTIQRRVDASLQDIENEGLYPRVGSFGSVAGLDNWTEKDLFGMLLRNSDNPLYAALNTNGWLLYWHGYVVVLRPMLLFIGLGSIRYLNIFVIILLMFSSAYLIAKKINFITGLGYLISLGLCHIYIFPLSISYSTVFITMTIAVITVCLFYEKWGKMQLFYFFIIIGSVINFLTLLIIPLLTLTYPLIICYFLEQQKQKKSCRNNFIYILKNSFAWFFGFGFTWIMKWMLVSLFLNSSPRKFAIREILSRMLNIGNPERDWFQFSRSTMFKLNIHNMFPKIAIVLAVLILSIWFILFVLLRARNKNAIVLLPILSICFYPYIWYFVWAQYSQLHHWMTYREQAGAVMAGLLFLINTVDFNIVHKFFNKRQEGNKW